MPYFQARTDILIGEAARRFLSEKTMMVAGLGGVGGQAAEALARAGIGHLILLDHDKVSPSNINRQLLALHSNIGQLKTQAAAARLKDINPEIRLTLLEQFLQPDGAEALFAEYRPDYLLDCIDSIACKAAMVKAAQAQKIPVISAMGAGNCLDVSKVGIAKLEKTAACPLAREMRRHMKALRGSLRYPVVYSTEERRQPLPHAPVGGDNSGRARAVNGTISYLPGLFGMMMSGYAINDLLQKSGLLSDK